MFHSTSVTPLSTETNGRRSRSSSGTRHHGGPAGPIMIPATTATTTDVMATAYHRPLPGSDASIDAGTGGERCRRRSRRWARRGSPRRRASRRDQPAGARACSTASWTCWAYSTTRGPHREAMSSSIAKTWPFWTAVIWSHPSRALDGLEALAAALRVGEEDEVRVGGDDRLGVELRVAAHVLGRVGDVAQAEQLVDLPDERRRAGAVAVRARARGRRSAGPPTSAATRRARRGRSASGRPARRPPRRGRWPRRAARSACTPRRTCVADSPAHTVRPIASSWSVSVSSPDVTTRSGS